MDIGSKFKVFYSLFHSCLLSYFIIFCIILGNVFTKILESILETSLRLVEQNFPRYMPCSTINCKIKSKSKQRVELENLREYGHLGT